MSLPTNKVYYRPYDSDSESESDASSISSVEMTQPPNYRQFASDLQLLKAAGPDMSTENVLVKSEEFVIASPYEKYTPPKTDLSGVEFPKTEASKTTITSVIMLDSRDRDKSVYLQPTLCSLRLPRIYRNITNFQILQLKLLSSFFYFSNAKNNLSISILEDGRLLSDGKKNVITSIIREGTYNIQTLVAEIALHLNYTPLFYDYKNGFTDWAPLFVTTGSYSLNFNQPGDNYYDALNDTYILNPTMTQIVSKYFQTLTAGLTSYTISQLKVAYYYPVLKEIILDYQYGPSFLNLSITESLPALVSGESVYSRIIYTFQGLDDQVIQEAINLNIQILDTYRLSHTFRTALINKYDVTYSDYNSRVAIKSSSLNTSLVNLLNLKYNQYLSEQLSTYNLSSSNYSNLSITNSLLLAILTDEYYYLQKMFSLYFGIQFGSYALAYYANVENQLPLQNAFHNIGVSSNYDSNVIINNISPQSSNILQSYQAPSPVYWPHLVNLPMSTDRPVDLSKSNPFNPITLKQDYSTSFVDANGILYQNNLLKSADLITNIYTAQYTTFRFRSDVRQTLRVIALPRPPKYRYPAYNKYAYETLGIYDASSVALFNNEYLFIEDFQDAKMDIDSTWASSNLVTVPGSGQFGISFQDADALWTTSNLPMNIRTNRTFFTYYAAYPPGTSGTTPITYSVIMNVTNEPKVNNFVTPLRFFFYQARSAFMADISDVRNEKALHYKDSKLFPVTASNGFIQFTAYAGETYYFLLRTDIPYPPSFAIRVFPSFPNGQTFTTLSTSLDGFNPLQDPRSNLLNFNYAKYADPSYIHLPIAPLPGKNGSDAFYSQYSISNAPMGYDSNGVSTDLTDYCGYIQNSTCNVYPGASTRIDPVSGYIFQVGLNGYNSNTEVYIPNIGNNILYSNALGVYTPLPLTRRETSIVHWYGNVYIPNTANQAYLTPNTYSYKYTADTAGNITNISSYPFTQFITGRNPTITTPEKTRITGLLDLSGYTFQDGNLSLGNGVMGISLIPDDGVWDVKRIMFRSAYTNSNLDPNRSIKYLGIYYASYLNTLTGEQVKLSNAIMKFTFSKAVTYTNSLNFGFDAVGGTYYEWLKTSNSNYLYGYAQTPGTMNANSNSYYSIVPFDATSNITTYSLLSGSLTPYPYYSDAITSPTYLDGVKPPTSQFVIKPQKKLVPDLNRGPPAGIEESQSKYEKSIPVTATMLQYLEPPLLCNQLSTAFSYGPFTDISGASPFAAPIFRVANYALFSINGVYNLYRYENNTRVRTFRLVSSLTLDMFFKNFSQSEIVAVSGNNTEFAFLAFSSANGVYEFQIETYSPSKELVQHRDTLTTYNCLPAIPAGSQLIEVESFNYTTEGGFTFTFTYGTWDSVNQTYTNIGQYGVIKATAMSDAKTPVLILNSAPSGGLTPIYEILQSANEPFGRFYLAAKTSFSPGFQPRSLRYPIRPFLASAPLIASDSHYLQNGLYYVDTNTTSPLQTGLGLPTVYLRETPTFGPYLTRLNLLPTPGLERFAAFGDITLVQNPYENKILLSYDMYDMSGNKGLPTKSFYEVSKLEYDTPASSNAYYTAAKQVIKDSAGNTMQADKIIGGGGGSFWLTYNEEIKSGSKSRYDVLWGNRGDSLDFPINISNAYQIFYPTQRIVMEKVARAYNPIQDISGLLYPEYPHTNLFAYNSYESYQADISGNRWGQESNYLVADTKFSGFTYGAAALDIPLLPSTTYYLAVRGYSPSENSQVMMRFSLPNRGDFGYVRITDLSNEIFSSMKTPSLFNSNYTNSIQAFNSNFIFNSNGRIFGANTISGFPGSNLSNVSGFGDFLKNFINLYTIYNSNVIILNTISKAVQSNIKNFISTDLANIIPPNSFNRQRYTDPFIYSVLWKTSLSPQYAKVEDNWGLGWNLGFDKADTTFNTTHVAPSFFKILDDYITLNLNEEFDMNRMDTGNKENLSQTKESTGSIKAYHAKLLLAPFGSYAQTIISNPITFQIPIPKMDKLTFNWQDRTGTTINNTDCEWNMVVQVVEEIQTVKAAAPPVVTQH